MAHHGDEGMLLTLFLWAFHTAQTEQNAFKSCSALIQRQCPLQPCARFAAAYERKLRPLYDALDARSYKASTLGAPMAGAC